MGRRGQKNKLKRRGVIVSRLVPREGRPRLWAYGYEDLASLFGLSVGYLRLLVSRGVFDPGDLESLFKYWVGRTKGKEG